MSELDTILSKGLLCLISLIALGYLLKACGSGRTRYERIEAQGGSALLSKLVMEMGYWSIQPLCRISTRLGITANALSYLALLAGAAAGGLIASGHFGMAAMFAVIGGLLDALDGMVARSTGSMTYSGKILDSALDRYVDFFLLAGLLYYFRNQVPLLLLASGALLGSFMISYTTALAEIAEVRLPRSSMRRPERLVTLIAGITLVPLVSTTPLIYALGLITFAANASSVFRIRKIRRVMDEREQRLISQTLAQVRQIRTHPKTPPRFGTR